jgi:hypothetical protein
VPLHHRGAAETRRIDRPTHDDAGPERREGAGLGLPASVGAAFTDELVGACGPVDAVLGLLVAERRKVVVAHDVRRHAGHHLERGAPCGGHRHPPISGPCGLGQDGTPQPLGAHSPRHAGLLTNRST